MRRSSVTIPCTFNPDASGAGLPRPFAHRVAPTFTALCLLAMGCEANVTHPPDTTLYDGGAAAPIGCVPNLDGVIQSSELAPILGVAATYRVNASGTARQVDVAGQVDSAGQLVWDWGASYANDQVTTIAASAVAGKWYAPSFPAGAFTTPFDAADTIEAVYTQDDNGLYLWGLASTDQDPSTGQTLWAYDTPVTLYVFPLQPGATWTSSGTIRGGIVDGLPYAAQDVYQGTDDAMGELVLPDFTFTQAHRLRFIVTTTFSAGIGPQVRRQVSFLSECVGEAARASSEPNETNNDFTKAVEQRRLGN